MINIKEIQELLSSAGLLATILVVDGFIYSVILFVILLYNLVFGNMGNSSYKDKES